ncbi:DUF4340 domain-containing protein [Treponema sp.]|uniref:DUF4340 domain-containing protein n=1 Tax=Treponema sp. TaxID=166 RepID=UPI00298E616D|nr:DUF4340 domain-containing protein [Treponema sp.]MCR5614100.1 DUF4340 domain-containing protein [Treponema sp.]
MQKRKSILLAVIAALSVVYIFQIIFSAKGKVKELKTKIPADKILISNTSGDIELIKRYGAWYTQNGITVKADAAKYIDDTLSTIKILDTVSLSKSEDEQKKYGLTNPITITTFAQNKKLRTLYIGKTSTTGNQTYIQFDDKKEIYLASGNMNSLFSITQNDLFDMTLYSVKESEIYKIQFSDNQGKNFTAEKTGAHTDIEWEVTQSSDGDIQERFNSAEFIEWIKSIVELKAESWIEDLDAADAILKTEPAFTLTIGAAGCDIRIALYADTEDDFTICLCSENNFPCRIKKEDADRLRLPVLND